MVGAVQSLAGAEHGAIYEGYSTPQEYHEATERPERLRVPPCVRLG